MQEHPSTPHSKHIKKKQRSAKKYRYFYHRLPISQKNSWSKHPIWPEIMTSVKSCVLLTACSVLGFAIIIYGFFPHTLVFALAAKALFTLGATVGTANPMLAFLSSLTFVCLIGAAIGALIGSVNYLFRKEPHPLQSLSSSSIKSLSTPHHTDHSQRLAKIVMQTSPEVLAVRKQKSEAGLIQEDPGNTSDSNYSPH